VIDVLEVKTDRGGSGVVVVADGYWPAKMGREALTIDWDTSGVEKVSSDKQLAEYKALAAKPRPVGAQSRYLQAGRRGEEDLGRV
jgi:isoquinoline 1-oxidoreductase beta subunit